MPSGFARVFPLQNSTTVRSAVPALTGGIVAGPQEAQHEVGTNSRAQGTAVVLRRELSMGLKSKVFAAAATLTLVGGVSTVGMLSASAATPSCGGTCIDIFSREFGTHRTPNFVLDVWRQGGKVGQPIILFRTSDTDPAEDINASFQGNVSDFFAAGLVSAAVNLHYGGGAVGFPDD